LNLKNYTSSVPVLNSISRIEHRLAQAGAPHIAKSYEGDRPTGMIFQIPINNIPMTFKLPAKTDNVFKYLIKQRSKPPKDSVLASIKAQSDRTAWKILSDWIDIQISMIEVDQAESAEMFLAYAFDPASNLTLFEKIKRNGFKQLAEGKI
jgi:hypothetical protein